MPASVSAIIVNYNGIDVIGDCLSSLRKQTVQPNEILVIDNASTDESAEKIERDFADVRLIKSPDNLGYAGACNVGIQESSEELVVVLNNDLWLEPDWLESLLGEVTPSWSFWASRIVFADDPSTIDSAGDAMAVVGSAYKIGNGSPAKDYEAKRRVFGPCGAAALYRRSMLEKLGGFDESFFLIYEDADLSMRALLQGFRCLYVPTAVVHHRVNQSIGRFSQTYVYYGHRNSEYLYWSCFPLSLFLLYLPERMFFNFLSLLYFTAVGRGPSFLKAKLDFLRNLPSVLRKRKRLQSERQLTPKAIRKQLDRNWLRNRRKAVRV